MSVFNPNTGKYGTEKTPYLDTFRAVSDVNSHNNYSHYDDSILITYYSEKSYLS